MPILNLAADNIAASSGFFEPQRKNHYQVDFISPLLTSGDQENLRLSIIGINLPTEGNEELEMKHKNESSWVAGRRELESGTFTVRDYVVPRTLDSLIKWRRLVYNPLTGAVGLARTYKCNGVITLTAPDGVSFERKWQLRGAWPTKVTFGELGDEMGDILVVQVNFRYDKAVPVFFDTGLIAGAFAGFAP